MSETAAVLPPPGAGWGLDGAAARAERAASRARAAEDGRKDVPPTADEIILYSFDRFRFSRVSLWLSDRDRPSKTLRTHAAPISSALSFVLLLSS